MAPVAHSSANDGPEISVVVPLFDEQENVAALYARLSQALSARHLDYELVLVDDGSRDDTPRLLDRLQADDPQVVVIHLSRNFGHQAAISAGLDRARGRAVVVMDGDLQDPPEVLDQFIAAWREGHEVVYAIRTKRKEGWPKRLGYALFYRLLRRLSPLDIPLDSGDFCLMDRQVVDVLKHLPERQRFVRGLRTFVGFRQVGIRYERDARRAGQPKYTLPALVHLACDGLIGFSDFPLRLVTYFALAALFAAGIMTGCWALGAAAVPAGVAALVWLGAVQLLSLAILGEYVRRIFVESKDRPTYIVREQRGGRPRLAGCRKRTRSRPALPPVAAKRDCA